MHAAWDGPVWPRQSWQHADGQEEWFPDRGGESFVFFLDWREMSIMMMTIRRRIKKENLFAPGTQ